MKIKKITAAWFSPTGNTRKIVQAVAGSAAERLGAPLETIDFTLPAARENEITSGKHELLVIGLPVYAGRIPNKILPFVHEKVKGDLAFALPVVTFGNRSFGDALSELTLELMMGGFRIAGAGAFVAEHCMVPELGTGRPNEKDLRGAKTLGRHTADRLSEISKNKDLGFPTVDGEMPPGPYYTPLKEDGTPAKFLKAKPVTDPERCTNCGTCAGVCPMGSIDRENVRDVKRICIKCQACVKSCPEGAKYFDDPDLLSHHAYLRTHFTEPQGNQYYLF